MTLVELRTFLAIIETGSLVAAADKLNVTQSTVTARLKSLEGQLGQSLVLRRKSGALATPAGQRLKRYAATIEDLWRQARQETALPEGLRSVCNMSVETDLWTGPGQRMRDFVLALQPAVAMTLWEGDAATLAGWLQTEKSDMALTFSPRAGADQVQFELPPDTLVLVSTKADAPLRFDPGYVFVEAGPEFARDHATFYADASTQRLSFGSAQLGLAFILDHGGSAYLPWRMVAERVADGRLHRIAGAPEFMRPVFLVANRRAMDAWDWFDDIVKSLLADDPHDGPRLRNN